MSAWRSTRAAWDASTNELTRAVGRARAEGVNVLDLTVSNPTITGDWWAREELSTLLAEGAVSTYAPEAAGSRRSREALATHLSTDGDSVDPDDLVLCASTSEAYSWLFKAAAAPGAFVLSHKPSYPLIPSLAELEAVDVRDFSLIPERGMWTPDLDELATNIEGARLLCLVNPNNPTGNYLDDAAVSIATRHGVPVVSDEVFLDFSLDGVHRRSLASVDEGLVFALGGLSKALALPHWKLAWIRIGGGRSLRNEARAALEWLGDSYLSVSTPVQAALPGLLQMCDDVQGRLLERLRSNLSRVRSSLSAVPGVEVWTPQGGWSVVVRVPAVIPDESLAIRLLTEARVLVHPGYFFELPWPASIVLSLLPRPDAMEEGLERIAAFLSRQIGA